MIFDGRMEFIYGSENATKHAAAYRLLNASQKSSLHGETPARTRGQLQQPHSSCGRTQQP